MISFEFYNPSKIIFGRDTESSIGEEIKKYAKKALFVHYGNGVIEKLGLCNKSIGMPSTLKEVDIEKKDFDRMAERCRMLNGDGTVGNFVKLIKKIF